LNCRIANFFEKALSVLGDSINDLFRTWIENDSQPERLENGHDIKHQSDFRIHNFVRPAVAQRPKAKDEVRGCSTHVENEVTTGKKQKKKKKEENSVKI
jgi:hypothetical protein